MCSSSSRSKEKDAVRVRPDNLRTTVTAIFEKLNVPAEDAHLGADGLVAADLRGVETHGVSNMLRHYVEGYSSGEINARPDWRIVRQTPATANIDSDSRTGHHRSPQGHGNRHRKGPERTGVGMVTISNGRHMGMASYHAMMALKHDMIGISMTGCPPLGPAHIWSGAQVGHKPHRPGSAPAGERASLRL